MADVNVQYSFTIQDALGTKASTVLYSHATDTSTGANLAAEWQVLAGLISAITSASVLHGSASIMQTFTDDAPTSDSRVEQTGVFDFPSSVSGRLFGVAVPGLDNSMIVDGEINLSDTDVAAFVSAIEGTYTTGGVFTNNNWQQLNDLADAFISFRKRRKQLSRSSYEIPS
jgi:hypothetical protein